MSARAAMAETLEDWAAAGSPARPIDREVLLVMADAIDDAGDAPRDAVAIINAARYLLTAVRQLAPSAAPDDGYDAAMMLGDDDA